MTPVLWALISLILQGVGDFIFRRVHTRGVEPSGFILGNSWFFGSTAILFALSQGQAPWEGTPWDLALPVGVIGYGAFFTFLISLRGGRTGAKTLTFRLSFVLTSVLAVLFLGEVMTLKKGLGIGLASLAVCLTAVGSLGLGQGGRGHRAGDGKRQLLAIVAMCLLSIQFFIYRLVGLRGVAPWAFLFGHTVTYMSSAFLLFALRGFPRLTRAGLLHSAVAGPIYFFGFAALLEGLKRGEASQLVPLAQLSFILTALLAGVFLKESLEPAHFAAFALAVAALLILAR